MASAVASGVPSGDASRAKVTPAGACRRSSALTGRGLTKIVLPP
jgi:hypothetical protein